MNEGFSSIPASAGCVSRLDFVFNHTYEHIGDKVYSFEGLVPGYYYRLKQDGTY
jgi:pullulanase/glycogen debranching enzyme